MPESSTCPMVGHARRDSADAAISYFPVCAPELVEWQTSLGFDKLSQQFGPWAPTPSSGGEKHSQCGSVGVDLRINAYFADQLRHGSVDVRLDPGGTMVQPEMRQTRQEDTT